MPFDQAEKEQAFAGNSRICRNTVLAVVSWCVLFSHVHSEPDNVQGPSEASAPVYRVGDTWTISSSDDPDSAGTTITLTVVSVSAKGAQISASHANGPPYEIDLDATGSVTRRRTETYDPSTDALRFPMSVGMSWMSNHTSSNGIDPAKTIASRVSVDGTEIIHVPAGDFFAFRLVGHAEVNVLHGSRFFVTSRSTSTYWYAPAVKRVVKAEVVIYRHLKGAERTETTELLNYSLVSPDAANAASAAQQ